MSEPGRSDREPESAFARGARIAWRGQILQLRHPWLKTSDPGWWIARSSDRSTVAIWTGNPEEVLPPASLTDRFPGLECDDRFAGVQLPPGFVPVGQDVHHDSWAGLGTMMVDVLTAYVENGADRLWIPARAAVPRGDRWHLVLPPWWSAGSAELGGSVEARESRFVAEFGRSFVRWFIGKERYRETATNSGALPIRWLNLLQRCGDELACPSLLELREMVELTASPKALALIGGATDRGTSPDRPLNEDWFGWRITHDIDRVGVADGLGGHDFGDRASRVAIEMFLEVELEPTQRLDTLALALAHGANASVRHETGGKGLTTLTGAVVSGHRFALAHVGDTRAYRYSRTEVRQITRDHSVVAAMIAAGLMESDSSEARTQRNRILRSIGASEELSDGYVDNGFDANENGELVLNPDEGLLLLTDGAWDVLDDHELFWLCTRHPEPQQLCSAIIATVMSKGAPDNVTAVAYFRSPAPTLS